MRYFFDELPIEPFFKVDGLTFDFNIFANGEAEVSLNGDDDFKIDAIRLEATSRNRTQTDKFGRPCFEARTLLIDPKDPAMLPLFQRVERALRDNHMMEIWNDLTDDAVAQKLSDHWDDVYQQRKDDRSAA